MSAGSTCEKWIFSNFLVVKYARVFILPFLSRVVGSYTIVEIVSEVSSCWTIRLTRGKIASCLVSSSENGTVLATSGHVKILSDELGRIFAAFVRQIGKFRQKNMDIWIHIFG